mgnify:CR=1 FL=1
MNNEISEQIIASQVAENKRSLVVNEIFGLSWSHAVEPAVYQFADMLYPDYTGGYWRMLTLSNGGFFMYPEIESPIKFISSNGISGVFSEVGAGTATCLMTYSNLSFQDGDYAAVCADQYHLLRDYLFTLSEHDVKGVLACID